MSKTLLKKITMISIHAAREGGDVAVIVAHILRKVISIHAAREGGDYSMTDSVKIVAISIHAAREGGDVACVEVHLLDGGFQSTPPVKAATEEEK